MSELIMERLRENLESLKMKNTLDILDNYLETAIKDKLNIVEVLDHIFSEEARNKRKRAYEKQIQMSGFPIFIASSIQVVHSAHLGVRDEIFLRFISVLSDDVLQ